MKDKAQYRHITQQVEGHTGFPCATKVISHTGELSSPAQVYAAGIKLQAAALAVGPIPGLSVAGYAAWSQIPGLPVDILVLPAQLQREGSEARRITLNS